MADLSKLCLGCMHELPDGVTECPHCKFSADKQNGEDFLPLRTVLSGRYIVGKVLSYNGEGVTYIGYDKESDMPVRIREYFPSVLCTRQPDGVEPNLDAIVTYKTELAEFLALARNLGRMRSLSAILPVYDIFEQNNTAYYISETVDSITLRDFLIRNGGALTFEQLRPLFMPLMQTLISLHSVGIIHRGISPDTLIIGKDGKMRLTEFCVAAARTARSDMAAHLFKGYAAIEQYGFDGEQGEWTDVYGLAATMYRALVGSPPPEATARVTNDKMIIPASVADSLSAYVMSGLANALQILPNERTQSVEQFRDEISASPTVITKAAARREGGQNGSNQPKKGVKKHYVIISMLATVLALAAIALIVYFGLFRQTESEEPMTTTAAITTEMYSENIIDPDKGVVPKFVDMTYADLLASTDPTLAEAVEKYNIVIETKQFSDKPNGTILSQSPKEGETIRKGDTIKVVLSMGKLEFLMPQIVGKTKEEAYIALLEAGFTKDTVRWAEKYSSSAAPDTVVEVDPKEGETVNGEMYVTVYMNAYKTTEPPSTRPPTYYWEVQTYTHVQTNPATEPPVTDEPDVTESEE